MQESQLRPLRVANGQEPWDTSGKEQLHPLQMMLFGALSGASAELVVYPMEVVRRRMQVQAASVSGAGEIATRSFAQCNLARLWGQRLL